MCWLIVYVSLAVSRYLNDRSARVSTNDWLTPPTPPSVVGPSEFTEDIDYYIYWLQVILSIGIDRLDLIVSSDISFEASLSPLNPFLSLTPLTPPRPACSSCHMMSLLTLVFLVPPRRPRARTRRRETLQLWDRGKTFITSSNSKRSVWTHTGEKPHCCHQREKHFSFSSQLRRRCCTWTSRYNNTRCIKNLFLKGTVHPKTSLCLIKLF